MSHINQAIAFDFMLKVMICDSAKRKHCHSKLYTYINICLIFDTQNQLSSFLDICHR